MTRSIELPDPPTKVIERPPDGAFPMQGVSPTGWATTNLIISVASAADSITAWGVDPRTRDAQLRAFWPTEPHFASGLFTVVAQYVAFGWSLKGPRRTVGIVQETLNGVQFGKGPEALLVPFLIDVLTQDNGGFIEIVRTDDEFNAPVVTLNHLDAGRCIRTGQWETPVIYQDIKGRWHTLKWYQVMDMTEMPSPQEEARGLQYCALTRILRAAQIMRDVTIVKQEKAAGRFTRQIHLVSGVQTKIIEDAVKQKQAAADAAGLTRYIQPLVLGSLDPTARVSKETIDLASLPDEYDEEKAFRTYIGMMALAFGNDYQSFAPLPGGGLGSGSESKILNMKSRGKGPALFMRQLQRLFNFHGILPKTVAFEFGEQDIAEQMERTELRKAEAVELETYIRAGLITPEVGRQIMVDRGILAEQYLEMMREDNADDTIVAPSGDPVEDLPHVKPGMPGPKEPPQKAPPAGSVNSPKNSNENRSRSPSTNQRRTPGGTPEGGARA